jgi:hypothetical protein
LRSRLDAWFASLVSYWKGHGRGYTLTANVDEAVERPISEICRSLLNAGLAFEVQFEDPRTRALKLETRVNILDNLIRRAIQLTSL